MPGLIAFRLLDDGSGTLADLDSVNDELVVVINGTDAPQTLTTGLSGTFTVDTETAPVPGASASAGDFSVPALSVAVFAR